MIRYLLVFFLLTILATVVAHVVTQGPVYLSNMSLSHGASILWLDSSF